MDQGEEAGSASLKEERLDFALWKATKEGEDTSWDSPWGPGRPAWHIECSVMAEQELGASFAVHGGGSDLVFPHHENEIAQSESAGRPFAHVWMHNGMVDSGGEKMSKSEGNIFQLSEALDGYGRDAVVAYLISGHYRQPLAFGDLQMEEAVARVERLRNFFREHPVGGDAGPRDRAGERVEAFREALADDFNTPRGMAEVFELVGEANRSDVPGAAEAVAEMLELVGLGTLTEERIFEDAASGTVSVIGHGEEQSTSPASLLSEREAARAAKDFARADEIRDELAAMGLEVRDSADGPRLVPKS
jgi:cysteinyl-tRNA synthetase